MTGMEQWKGEVALVTGASSGIGRAVCLALARAGMRVALVARRVDRLNELASQIQAVGAEPCVLPADLRDEQQILAVFERVRERWGGVDVLVNSAGIGRVAPLLSGRTEDFRELLQVNVLALSIATREALGDMRRRGKAGHVVHVSSMSAYRVQRDAGMYAATKFAVRALTEGLRLELRAAKSKIRISAVSPGDTATGFREAMVGNCAGSIQSETDYPEMDAEDVAAAVIHALSQPLNVEIHDILMRPTGQPD